MREETLLRDILDYDLLQKHLADGVVRRQAHPLYPELNIHNYTEKAAFDRIWDGVTNVCRGLITVSPCLMDNGMGEEYVLARGFNKFHNLNTDWAPETMEANLPEETPLVTTKLDGSMGILYRWDKQLWVATRGSFDSEQARWATTFIRKYHPEIQIPEGKTVLVEIIY